MAKAEEEGLEKRFKISTTISTSNLVCFDKEGRIKKYDNVNDILKDFFEERLKYYQARKVRMSFSTLLFMQPTLSFPLSPLLFKGILVGSAYHGMGKARQQGQIYS